MPDDDFKLSLDIEANLSKLDSTLQQAAAKVSSAGAKMQAALFANGVGGQGGGFTGVSGIATPAASGPGVTGTSVSFGGNANIQTQSSINAQLAATQNNRLGGALVSNMSRSMGGGGGGPLGVPGWGRFAAGVAGAGYVGMRAIDSINNELSAYGSVKLAERYRDNLGASGYAERMQAAGQAEASARSVPLIGWAYGARLDMKRAAAYASGDYANSSSPSERAKGAFALRELQNTNNRGFLGGGYGGQLTALYQQSEQFQRDVIGNQGKMAPNDFKNFVREGSNNLKRQYDETVFGQQQKIADITSATQQSQFRAMGGSLFANLAEVQRQFRQPIATLEQQNDPRNRPELDALRKQQSAAMFETIVGSIQPAQEFTPGTIAAGGRVQGMFGQDQKVLQTLTHMDANIGASLMQAVVGRN